MREIKFRARINKAGEVEGLSVWQKFNIFDLMDYPGLKELVDWHTFGMFTGLCDKNSKEIYEGDIICYHDQTGEVKASVFWGMGCWCLNYGTGKGDLVSAIGADCFQIIGNVYENPELLINEKGDGGTGDI
jgi:uncharacterized phage protein (TIGR01671 family)